MCNRNLAGADSCAGGKFSESIRRPWICKRAVFTAGLWREFLLLYSFPAQGNLEPQCCLVCIYAKECFFPQNDSGLKLEEPVETELPEEGEKRDSEFCKFVQKTLGKDLFSSIQITGEGFSQDWAVQSVKILCFQKRRVFYGNNLFAKGACAAGKEKLEDKVLKGYRFLSDSLVMADVGMEMRVMGSPAYYPLIENGNNWYDCHASCELILDNTEELVFIISTFDRPEKRRVGMMLPGIPHRPNKTTRLSL